MSQILTQKSTSWTACLGKGVDKIFCGPFLSVLSYANSSSCARTHTHTHTHSPERRVSLCCGGMNPWQHPCCTVRDPYFCHPEGGHVRRKPARMRQEEKDKVVSVFWPHLPSCGLVVVQYISSVRPASLYSPAVKNGIISLIWCVTTKVVPCSQVFVCVCLNGKPAYQ